MKENGAPPALDSWEPVVAGFHHDIVEMVGTFQIFVGGCIGQINPAVIVSIAYSFTPAPTTSDRCSRNFRKGSNDVVIAEVNLAEGPNPDRAYAIPLFLANISS